MSVNVGFMTLDIFWCMKYSVLVLWTIGCQIQHCIDCFNDHIFYNWWHCSTNVFMPNRTHIYRHIANIKATSSLDIGANIDRTDERGRDWRTNIGNSLWLQYPNLSFYANHYRLGMHCIAAELTKNIKLHTQKKEFLTIAYNDY